MSLDLIYERLALERIEAENAAETVVEGTVTLPERSAEIGRALKLQAAPKVSKVEVREGKVVFEGALDLSLLYAHYRERRIEQGEANEFDDEYDDAEFSAAKRWSSKSSCRRPPGETSCPSSFCSTSPGIRVRERRSRRPSTSDSTSFEVRSDRFSVDVDVVLAFSARSVSIQELTVAKAVKGASGVVPSAAACVSPAFSDGEEA